MKPRVCLHCNEEKPIDQFQVAMTQGRQYRRSTCKPCMLEYYRVYNGREHRKSTRRVLALKIAKLEKWLEDERQKVRELTERLEHEQKRNGNLYSWTG